MQVSSSECSQLVFLVSRTSVMFSDAVRTIFEGNCLPTDECYHNCYADSRGRVNIIFIICVAYYRSGHLIDRARSSSRFLLQVLAHRPSFGSSCVGMIIAAQNNIKACIFNCLCHGHRFASSMKLCFRAVYRLNARPAQLACRCIASFQGCEHCCSRRQIRFRILRRSSCLQLPVPAVSAVSVPHF